MTGLKEVNGSTRRHLPPRRKSFTIEVVIGGSHVCLGCGMYEDGMLGEIWIDMHKYGATLRHWIGDTAQLFSIGLQYGIPLVELCKPFKNSRSDPCGEVKGHATITHCTSIMDFVIQVLTQEFINARKLPMDGGGEDTDAGSDTRGGELPRD